MVETFHVGDMVKVYVSENKLDEMKMVDPESFYYIESYFGKVGRIVEITTTSSGFKNYHVDFGKDTGIFYGKEILHVTDSNQ